ncbi:hypothetical protein GE09DRAFT_500314 [Coniochaeta sp. 2T2.1]|nr:hypothetical protein GE09DRAFT_500314 [Coniochaeta sp. 2T2.1]
MSTALSQAATLKPEIRLAQALSEFCGSLAEPRAREFKSLQTTSPPTPTDVITLTEETNRHGARTHKAWWSYGTRMASFLDKVQSMSRIGDFLLGSAQNMMASGIWAAVKITLGVAVGSLSFFKRVSELFLKVGKSSSITKDLVQVYPESKDLQHLMCEYLITLVAFCQKIVAVLDKPTMLQLASPFIGFFDKEAGKFEADLNQWATAIDRKATVLLSQRQLDAPESVTRISRTLAKWAPVEAKKRQAKKQQDLVLRSNRVQDRLCSKKSERVAVSA